MSQQKDLLREIAAVNSGAPDRIAVRWQLSATYDGKPFEQSLMAIYRFEEGRIAEDWGFGIRELWP
jgi:ketosteroid isomerase-like protein